MKKSLLSLLFLLACMCFHTSVLAQQDAKSKAVNSDADRIVNMYAVGNRIFTENAPIGKWIEVFSVVGIKVQEFKIETPSGEYLLTVPKGYYILRIKDTDTMRRIAITR